MSTVRRVGITGAGFYVPDRVMPNQEFEKFLDTSNDWIQSRTGIRERRLASPEQASSDLGAFAAQRALEDAGIPASEIDLIVVASSSPDYFFPSTACLIQARLGAARAAAFDLTAVCTGFQYALVTGSQMVAARQADKVLVVAAEKFSTLLDWQDRSTAVLMGDGAGAVVLTADAPRGELLASTLHADGQGVKKLWVPAGGSALPASHETVDQRLHFMKMDGHEIYKFAVHIIGESISETLAQAGLKEGDLDLLIPHQANIRIIQSAAKRLNLSMDKVVLNIDRYSNTSAASIPIALAEAKQQGRLQPGMIVALVGFGAGLTWGTTIVRW